MEFQVLWLKIVPWFKKVLLLELTFKNFNFGKTLFSRWFNGCKIPQKPLPSETSQNGRKNVMLRGNLTVLCQTLVLVKPENCLEKPFDYTHAWNVPIIILGSWIPLAMVSHSNKFDIPTPHTFTSTFVFMIIIVSFRYDPVLWENKLDSGLQICVNPTLFLIRK